MRQPQAVIVLDRNLMGVRFEGVPGPIFDIYVAEFKASFTHAKWNGQYWLLPRRDELTARLFCLRRFGHGYVIARQSKISRYTPPDEAQGRLY